MDVAVIAVPAAAVPGWRERCGSRGVHALIVVSPSGLGRPGRGAAGHLPPVRHAAGRPELLRCAVPVARPERDLRRVGARPPARRAWSCSPAASASRCWSTWTGSASASRRSRRSVTSTTCPATTCSTWWEQDGQTKLAVLYVESFGSPREFARTARRVGAAACRCSPCIGGRSAAGQRGRGLAHRGRRDAPGHPGGAVRPGGHHRQCQPRRTGRGRGAAVQPAAAGRPPGRDRVQRGRRGRAGSRRLRRRGLRWRSLSRPPAAAERAAAARRGGVRAGRHDGGRRRRTVPVLPGAGGGRRRRRRDPRGRRADGHRRSAAVATAQVGKPMAAALLDQPETVRLIPVDDHEPSPLGGDSRTRSSGSSARVPAASAGGAVPVYGYPESAARALAHAAGYRRWRERQHGQVPDLAGLAPPAPVPWSAEFLTATPKAAGCPRPRPACSRSYRIPLAATRRVSDEQEAVAAAADLGGHVVLKAEATGWCTRPRPARSSLTCTANRRSPGVRGAGGRVRPGAAAGTGAADARRRRRSPGRCRAGADVRAAGGVRARRRRHRGPRRPRRAAGAADRRRRRRADSRRARGAVAVRPPRDAGGGHRARWPTCCCGSPGSPTTCPRSPNWTSTRSSPGRTARTPLTSASGSLPAQPRDPFLRRLR